MSFPYPVCPVCQKNPKPGGTVTHSHLGVQIMALRCPCGSWLAYDSNQDLLRMDFSAYTYDREASWTCSPATRKSYEKLVNWLSRFRRLNRWLDVGCGAGHLLRVVREAGWEVVGTELSQVAVQRLEKEGYRVYASFLRDIPEPPQSFDVVTLIEVLEHVPEPIALLTDIRGFLRPGGCLYLTTPNTSSLQVRLRGIECILVPPDHVWVWSPKALRRLLLKTGFQPLRIWTEGVNPYKLFTKPSELSNNQDLIRKTEELRHRSAHKASWKMLKNIANWIMRLTNLGDTLKAIAYKK